MHRLAQAQGLWVVNVESEAYDAAKARHETEAALAAARESIRRLESEVARLHGVVDELETPMLLVEDAIKAVPIVGIVDSMRAAKILQRVLSRVSERQLEVVIVDVQGVTDIDTATAHHLVNLAAGVRLLGARFCVTGIQPAVAETLVSLGVGLENLKTFASVKQALAWAKR